MDIVTLSVISVFLAFTYSLSLLLLNHLHRQYKGLVVLSLALASIGTGFMLISLGNDVTHWISKVLANSLIAAGAVFLVHGFGTFRGYAAHYNQIAYISLATCIISLVYFTFFHISTEARIIIISAHMGLCMMLSILVNIYGQKKDNPFAKMMLTTGLTVFGFFMLFRIAWTANAPGIPDFMQAGTVHQIAFVALMLLIVFIGFSVTWMVSSRMVDTVYHASIEDSLTRLYNRRALEEFVPKELARAKRHGEHLSFLLLDIDNFKKINDTYGHQTGDSVLKTIARILNYETRKEDSCFRYGGEEFLVTLPATDEDQAMIVAEKLRKRVSRSQILPSRSDICTISIGVATLESETNWRDIIENADQALYVAKATGRDRVMRFDLETMSPANEVESDHTGKTGNVAFIKDRVAKKR